MYQYELSYFEAVFEGDREDVNTMYDLTWQEAYELWRWMNAQGIQAYIYQPESGMTLSPDGEWN